MKNECEFRVRLIWKRDIKLGKECEMVDKIKIYQKTY
jgi:hypothetical protein